MVSGKAEKMEKNKRFNRLDPIKINTCSRFRQTSTSFNTTKSIDYSSRQSKKTDPMYRTIDVSAILDQQRQLATQSETDGSVNRSQAHRTSLYEEVLPSYCTYDKGKKSKFYSDQNQQGKRMSNR